MAKKKQKETEADEFEDEDLEDEDFESAYPKIKETPAPQKAEPSLAEKPSLEEPIEAVSEEGEFEQYIEEEIEIPEYKHLKLDIIAGEVDKDYELTIKGQSHGFCNILVKHLLKTEGVNAAAYKITGISPPTVFIRLEDGNYKIKNVILKSIELLRENVLEVQKLFSNLM